MVVLCVGGLHELLGTAIRTFLMYYIKEPKVRTRQHSYGRTLALDVRRVALDIRTLV